MQNGKHLRLSLKALATAVLLGLLGNIMLRDVSWGVGFTAYFMAFLAACAYLYRDRVMSVSRNVLWLIPPAVAFALAFAWRDAISLKVLNGFAIATLIGIAALRRHQENFSVGTVLDYPFRLFGRWIEFVADGVALFNLDGRWPLLAKMNGGQHASAVLRGLVLAGPLLLLFGGLFASADASFERLLNQSISIDGEEALWNLGCTIGCAWLVAGFLRRMFLVVDNPPVQGPPAPGKGPATLGIIEIGTVLGLLNLLFIVFVATQLPYFFGGSDLVQSTAGLGYAEYARRGFFELAAVAALALPVLLGAHALLKREGDQGFKIYRVMAGVLVALLVVVITSAALRMRLYVDVYGISMLRIYVFATIAWLTAVFGWFVVTVLRDRPQQFAFGSLSMLLGVIFLLNVVNPEALTARINTTRVASTHVDTAYLRTLGSDAVPSLVKALKRLDPATAADLKKDLQDRKREYGRADWRSWNLAEAEAERALGQLR